MIRCTYYRTSSTYWLVPLAVLTVTNGNYQGTGIFVLIHWLSIYGFPPAEKENEFTVVKKKKKGWRFLPYCSIDDLTVTVITESVRVLIWLYDYEIHCDILCKKIFCIDCKATVSKKKFCLQKKKKKKSTKVKHLCHHGQQTQMNQL